MQHLVDKARPVRPGEEIDAERLAGYLADAVGISGTVCIEQFPSGFSNLTYLVRAGDRELVLRRPPVGSKVKAAHDMGREYRVLSALNPVYPAAPRPLVYCTDVGVIGAPFYVMERIKGVILRGKKPPGFSCPPDVVRKCCESFVGNFVRLHQLDYEKIGLGDLRREGWFVQRQANGWVDRYHGSQTDAIRAIDLTAEYLQTSMPKDTAAVLIHNDYKFDNMVLDPADLTNIIGVLDWEMCTIGDPLMDLGVVLSYWNEPNDPSLGVIPCFLTHEPGCLTRLQVAQSYAEKTGVDLANLGFYYVFGLFKLAVIAQQIYYRYKQGLTKDERFAPLIYVVATLGQMACAVIEGGRI